MDKKPELNIENVMEEKVEDVMEEKVEDVKKVKPKRKMINKTNDEEQCECTKEACVDKSIKTWKEVFKANYEGTSDEAKAIEPFLKKTFKEDVYIPWATMERLVYMCDDNARFVNICNANGGLVHSDILINHQKNTQKGEVISETEAPMYAHFVKVALVFMGKEFVEDYPIQDKDYSPARIFDQNLVNKALQRAKAKVGARATGLGLRLYEGFDLQFEPTEKMDKKPVLDIKDTKVVSVKDTKKVEEPKVVEPTKVVTEPKAVEPTKVVEEPAKVVEEPVKIVEDIKKEENKNLGNKDILEVIKFIRDTDKDKITATLQRINISILQTYGFALSTTDSDDELYDKISKFTDAQKFYRGLVNLTN